MNRIIGSLGVLALIYMGPEVFHYFMSDSGSAGVLQSAPSVASRAGIGKMLETLNGGKLTELEWSLVSAGVFAYSAFLGYASYFMLGDRAFGPKLNGAIALSGAGFALLAYSKFVARGSANDFNIMMFAAIMTSFLFLALAAVIKTFALAEADTFMAGGSTSIGKTVKSVVPKRAAKGPSASRIDAMVAKRR